MDYEAGYAPNLLQVWRVTPDSLALEWEMRTGEYAPASGWGASDPTWIDANTVELVKHEPQDVHGIAITKSRIRLVRQPNAEWSIQPLPGVHSPA